MKTTEAHSFDLSGAFFEDPYLARSSGQLGRTMRNIQSLQEIPGIKTIGRRISPQRFNNDQSPNTVQNQPQTHFSGYNKSSIYPQDTQADVQKYRSHIYVSDPKADNQRKFSSQNTGTIDHLAQYLDTRYSSMSHLKGESNISARVVPQQYRPKSMSETKFINVPSLTQLAKPSPLQDRGLISKI